jgi:hypothetical protein
VIDESVLGRFVFGLERTEESLLSTEDLDSGSRVLGKTHQATGVGDEPRSHEFSHHHAQVRCDGLHSVLEVIVELLTVVMDVQHLPAQLRDVVQIFVADLRRRRVSSGTSEPSGILITYLCAHRKLGSFLHLSLQFLRKDLGKV